MTKGLDMQRNLVCTIVGALTLLMLAGPQAAGQTGKAQTDAAVIIKLLRDADPEVRYNALNSTAALRANAKEIAPDVIRLLKDPKADIRARALAALTTMQNAMPDLGKQFPESVPPVIQLLSDRDPADKFRLVPRNAANLLDKLGPLAKAAVPELLKIAVDKNEGAPLRVASIQALGSIGEATPDVVAGLSKLLDDPTGTNPSYPTVGGAANSALGRFKSQPEAASIFLVRLHNGDDQQRASAARGLGTAAFGSLVAEKALLEVLDDKSELVQRAALSSLEGINETYAFFFRNNVTSAANTQKQEALLSEIKDDPERRERLAKISAAQFRLGNKIGPARVNALKRLVKLDARDSLPLLKTEFANLKKEVVYLERADLRLQLIATLAAWLPEKEAIPFLIAVDTDQGEAPKARFRAAVLLCERGDKVSVAHIVKQHSAAAAKIDPLIPVDELQNLLKDRKRYLLDNDFEGRKPVSPEELLAIERGIQLAQHFYASRNEGEVRSLALTKIHLNQGAIESMHFRVTGSAQWWSFELRKKGDYWLPCNFYMTGIA
jgi:HEAT repeat protein